MEKHKVCCFFGHRNTVVTDKEYGDLKNIIEHLIKHNNVKIFLFGSKSNFENTCHKIITELKKEHPLIERKCYTCRSETCILESDLDKWKKLYNLVNYGNTTLYGFEEEVEHKTKYISGKASYVERNQAIIDDSDYCIFYYDENYLPKTRKLSRKHVVCYQPKSGTRLAYDYAVKKKKIIFNIKQYQ